MSSISDSPLYSAMLTAAQSGGARDATSGYSDDYDDDLASILKDELGLDSIDEAEAFIDIAQSAAEIASEDGDITVDDVLRELFELLGVEDEGADADFDDVNLEDLEFLGYVEDAFAEIASGDGVFLDEDAGDLASMLGIEDDEALALIQFSGGDFKQMIKLLYDGDGDGSLSFEEFTADQGALQDKIDAGVGVMNSFDGSYGGYNFAMNDDGTIPESGHIAQASIEEGKAAMAEFLMGSLGLEDGDATDLINELESDGLLTFDEESGTIGNHAFIQFKSMVAEYSMKTYELSGADSGEKKEAFLESAEDARTALQETYGEDWTSDEATEEMISQIDEYYNGQMSLMESMSTSIQSAADMTAQLSASIGDINAGGEGAPAPGPAM